MIPRPPAGETFDRVADRYDEELAAGLAVTGESKEYFSRRRVERIAGLARELAVRPRTVLDFGCGNGSTLPLLIERLGCDRAVGLDVSERSLELAARHTRGLEVELTTPDRYRPRGDVDLAYSSAVFHHVAPAERPAALDLLRRSLRPGGLFALWEHNPANPGTRYVMSRVPFDRDAVPVWPRQARRLLAVAGFEVLRTDFLFFFPRALRWLRGLEPALIPVPLGGQYLVLARSRPDHGRAFAPMRQK